MGLLRDRSEQFQEAGVEPYGISRDSPWSHLAWSQALDLSFPLLSDWNGEAVRALGIAQEHRGFRDVAVRSVFLLGVDGRIHHAERLENDEMPDLDATLEAAAALTSPGS
jgi:peroxiredoxin